MGPKFVHSTDHTHTTRYLPLMRACMRGVLNPRWMGVSLEGLLTGLVINWFYSLWMPPICKQNIHHNITVISKSGCAEGVLMEPVMTLACQDRGFGFGRSGESRAACHVNSTLEKRWGMSMPRFQTKLGWAGDKFGAHICNDWANTPFISDRIWFTKRKLNRPLPRFRSLFPTDWDESHARINPFPRRQFCSFRDSNTDTFPSV